MSLAQISQATDHGSSGTAVNASEPTTLRVFVLRAIDGDTAEVRLLDGRTEDVRYIGIDTPESVKPSSPVECGGPRASHANAAIVDGRPATLRFDAERRDIYGRLLAYVYVDGRMVNAELAGRGLARTLEIEPNTSHAGLFRRLAARASRRGSGLWGMCALSEGGA